MKIPFCEKCKKLMKMSSGGAKCECGFEKQMSKEESTHKEKIKRKAEAPIKASEISNPNATYPHRCSKCGYDKAEMIMSEPWYSDADQNLRYKCGKCGHVEKDRLAFT